jgi:hypothetical protein
MHVAVATLVFASFGAGCVMTL